MSFFNKLKDFKEKPTNKLKEEILNVFFQKPKKHTRRLWNTKKLPKKK